MSNSPNYLTFKKTQGSLKGESGSLLQVTYEFYSSFQAITFILLVMVPSLAFCLKSEFLGLVFRVGFSQQSKMPTPTEKIFTKKPLKFCK